MLSKQEWNNFQQLRYNVMPEWWWDRTNVTHTIKHMWMGTKNGKKKKS